MNRNSTNVRAALACCSLGILLLISVTVGCDTATSTASHHPTPLTPTEGSGPKNEKKIGVLLVSHGSHSENWRKMVSNIETVVRDEVLKNGRIAEIRSAFMEYTEPSIATQLKEFDHQGFTDVIVIPLLLTVSSHSFDDIPTITGQKQDHLTTENLRLEGIEIHKPNARVHIAPLLDFPSVLGENVVRRVRKMSKTPDNEAIVLVAYGSEPYEEQWKQLLEQVSDEVKRETGVDRATYCWCGHIARYRSEPTEKAIREVLEQKERALVVPVLVAVDEMFQGKIIGGAIKSVNEADRIVYRHDSILPDENVNRWVIDISAELAAKLADGPEAK